MANAEIFNDDEKLFLSREWVERTERSIEVWKAHRADQTEVAQIEDILRRAQSDEGISKAEARILQAAHEEGERLLKGTNERSERRGWWQKQQLPTGEIIDRTPRPSPHENAIPAADRKPERGKSVASSTKKRVDRTRWSPAEQKRIFRGFRALMSKDKNGRSLQDRIDTTLRREGLVIDEMSFFRPHGPYSMMMPDTHEAMLGVLREYRMLPIAADASRQEDADRIQDLIERAKKGDLSPNQFSELESDIERIRESIKDYKISKGEQSPVDDEPTEDVSDVAEEEPKAQRKMVSVRWKEKWEKVQLKNKWKKEWEKKRDATKEWSTFTERFMVLFTAKLGWGGEGTTARSPAEYDDIFHATDGIVRMDRELMGENGIRERVRQTYSFDTTDTIEEGIQKTANTLRFIDMALLTTLEFAQTYDADGNVEVEGMQKLVPRLNYVISRPLAAEVAILLQKNRYDLLALHPLQLMILKQAQAQVHAFMGYIETEYKHDRRRRDNKVQIINSFARLRDLIDAAAEEREAVLRDELDTLVRIRDERELTEQEQETFAMLTKGSALWIGGRGNEYGESYDNEHGKYVRVFRPDRTSGTINKTNDQRTRAWWRMTALVEKYPAVRTEEDGGEKVKKPVPMPDKRRGKVFEGKMRTRARFRKQEEPNMAQLSDVINNTPPSETEA